MQTIDMMGNMEPVLELGGFTLLRVDIQHAPFPSLSIEPRAEVPAGIHSSLLLHPSAEEKSRHFSYASIHHVRRGSVAYGLGLRNDDFLCEEKGGHSFRLAIFETPTMRIASPCRLYVLRKTATNAQASNKKSTKTGQSFSERSRKSNDDDSETMAGGRRRHKHSKRKRLKHLDDRDAALEDLCYLERGRAASEVSDSKRPPSSISLTHSQDTSTVEGGTESVAPDDLVSLLRVNRLLKEQNALLTQRQLLLDASRSVPGGPEDDSLHSSITNPISFVSAIQLDVESQGRTKESLAVCQTTDPSNRLFERTAPTVGIPEPKVAPSSPEPGKQE